MLELSPLETAAKAVGLIDTRLLQSVSVETHSLTLRPLNSVGRRRNAIGTIGRWNGHGMTHAVELSGRWEAPHAAAAHKTKCTVKPYS